MSTQAPCTIWAGPAKRYQSRASDELFRVGRNPAPWAWITTNCGTEQCIEPDHLLVHAPMRLNYPFGVCIYCGRHGGTRDHLLPRNWTGDTQRHFVVTVPSCGTCNNLLGSTLTWSITERRAICHVRLRRHFRSVLRTLDRTEDELDEFGPMLRDFLVDSIIKKREVERMLDWPTDPYYDLRALEKSGIENPYVTGLLVAEDAEFDAIVRAST